MPFGPVLQQRVPHRLEVIRAVLADDQRDGTVFAAERLPSPDGAARDAAQLLQTDGGNWIRRMRDDRLQVARHGKPGQAFGGGALYRAAQAAEIRAAAPNGDDAVVAAAAVHDDATAVLAVTLGQLAHGAEGQDAGALEN